MAIWLLLGFFQELPKEIEEAAIVEGYGFWMRFWKVILPLTLPGLAVTAIFMFIFSWNEFMFAYMFTTVDARTVPIVLSEARGDEIIFWQDLAAQATLLIAPTLLLGLLMQRYLVRGLATGAVK